MIHVEKLFPELKMDLKKQRSKDDHLRSVVKNITMMTFILHLIKLDHLNCIFL